MLTMFVGCSCSQTLHLRDFNWKEHKETERWVWSWEAKYEASGSPLAAGLYVLVADQRAVQLSQDRSSNPYLQRLVGRLMHVPNAHTAEPRALAAARLTDWLRADPTREKNLSGGSNLLASFGHGAGAGAS